MLVPTRKVRVDESPEDEDEGTSDVEIMEVASRHDTEASQATQATTEVESEGPKTKTKTAWQRHQVCHFPPRIGLGRCAAQRSFFISKDR